MRLIHTNKFACLFIAAAFAILGGCGGGSGGGSSSGGAASSPAAATTATPASLSLSTSTTSVKSDDSTQSTITVTVLDSSNAVLPNETVNLQASTGILGASSVVTDATGKATTTFSSGTSLGTNRTATITASISGTSVTGSIPIQITGSTLTLSIAGSASVNTGTATPLTATVKNAGGTPVANQALRFSIASSSTGSGTLSSTTALTNSSGVATINFTGTVAGQVNVLAEWLDGSGATTATATQTFNVAAAGSAFQVTTPATSPYAVTLGTTQAVTVTVPSTILGVSVAQVRYSTTLGTWNTNAGQANCNTAGQKVCTVVPAGNSDTETFAAGIYAGNANIQIDALDASGKTLSTASLVLSLSAAASSAAGISLQPSVSVLAPSSGGNNSTATLTAKVTDASNNPVGGANVLFSLVNPTGSGEQISPVIVTTASTGTNLGVANSTFYAGTSTTQGYQIKASVIGTAVSATTNITVGGTAGSVAIGTSTTIAANTTDTAYTLPVTVMVTDSNGNPVNGAVVSLSLWPSYYYKGYRAGTGTTPCAINSTYTNVRFSNEDVNENLILDPGEDIDGPGGATLTNPATAPVLGTPDGALWPPLAAAGSVPSTVTTGADGTATFNWTYLKQYANWVQARLKATTQVQGTEATTQTYVTLTPSSADATSSPCVLPSYSPFN